MSSIQIKLLRFPVLDPVSYLVIIIKRKKVIIITTSLIAFYEVNEIKTVIHLLVRK